MLIPWLYQKIFNATRFFSAQLSYIKQLTGLDNRVNAASLQVLRDQVSRPSLSHLLALVTEYEGEASLEEINDVVARTVLQLRKDPTDSILREEAAAIAEIVREQSAFSSYAEDTTTTKDIFYQMTTRAHVDELDRMLVEDFSDIDPQRYVVSSKATVRTETDLIPEEARIEFAEVVRQIQEIDSHLENTIHFIRKYGLDTYRRLWLHMCSLGNQFVLWEDTYNEDPQVVAAFQRRSSWIVSKLGAYSLNIAEFMNAVESQRGKRRMIIGSELLNPKVTTLLCTQLSQLGDVYPDLIGRENEEEEIILPTEPVFYTGFETDSNTDVHEFTTRSRVAPFLEEEEDVYLGYDEWEMVEKEREVHDFRFSPEIDFPEWEDDESELFEIDEYV